MCILILQNDVKNFSTVEQESERVEPGQHFFLKKIPGQFRLYAVIFLKN